MPDPVTIHRRTVHEQVWAQPMQAVAHSYGLSGTALARICRYLEIPTPSLWRWSRYGGGQPKALPPAIADLPAEIILADLAQPHDRFGTLTPRPPVPEITVAPTLNKPHPFLISAERILKTAARAADSVIHLADQAMLDLRVSIPALERGLRLMDALVKAVEARGHCVEVRARQPASTGWGGHHADPDPEWASSVIRIDTCTVPFCITEGERQVVIPPDQQRVKRRRVTSWEPSPQVRYRQEPTGLLSLHLPGISSGGRVQRHWNDGKRQRLESCLHHVIASAEHLAANEEIERLEHERAEAARVAAERRAAEAERQRQLHRRRVHDLHSRIDDWKSGDSIRTFAAAVEAETIATTGSPVPPDSDLAHWLLWAKKRADSLQEEAIRTVLQLRETPSEQRDRPGPYPSEPLIPKTYWETRNWWNR